MNGEYLDLVQKIANDWLKENFEKGCYFGHSHNYKNTDWMTWEINRLKRGALCQVKLDKLNNEPNLNESKFIEKYFSRSERDALERLKEQGKVCVEFSETHKEYEWQQLNEEEKTVLKVLGLEGINIV